MRPFMRQAAIAAFCLITLAVFGLNDFSWFTDAGIHYEFSEDLARFWRWPLPPESTLGTISHYRQLHTF